MIPTPNTVLIAWMSEHRISSNVLAEMVNQTRGELTGKAGGLDGSSVRDWKAGRVRWPNAATRAALEKITGRTAPELGFVPRSKPPNLTVPQLPEDLVQRRVFIAATTGAALSVLPATPLTVGTADVQRLRHRLSSLWLLDDQAGGGPDLEKRAVALSDYAMDLQHQIWRYASTLAGQRGRWADAVAASDAAMATSVHRRDPLYASLGHARLAVSLPGMNEPTRARRALDRADQALARADGEALRPASMAFYSRGELDGLAGVTHLRLGDAEKAESHLHRCLSALRADQHRNRAYYTVHVAFAQLAQTDIDQACATAARVIPPSGSTPAGRIHHLLGTFTRQLNRLAPDARTTRDWNERTRTR